MKGVKILDSSAVLAYFEGEEGGKHVTSLLKEGSEKEKNLLISVVNWGEVLYVVETRYGKGRRDEIEHIMSQMHLEVIDVGKDLAREAAQIKASRKLPYADCFAAALTRTRKGVLVTTDKDFKVVDAEINIEWL